MQKTRSVMIQLITINVVNVICSLYLAVVLDYGIFGVALGSVLAQFSGLFMSIIIFSYSLKKLNLITLNFKKF